MPNITEPVEYRNCKIVPESGESTYFGVGGELSDDEGYQTEFVRVSFPDNTWCKCANVDEARRYINEYLKSPECGV